MGSVGEFEKGETPFLDRIKQHNADYHLRIAACRKAAPVFLKLMARLGVRQPLYNWEIRNQHKYWLLK